MATKIDQKEYLKKYLSNDKDKKKKKKKEKKAIARATVRIIDDDLDLSKLQSIQEDEVDLFALGEEAPQVVGIIDDRPAELRAKEDFCSHKWKVVAACDGFDTTLKVTDVSKRKAGTGTNFDVDLNPVNIDSTLGRKRRDSDESPPRKASAGSSMRRRKDSDNSPPRRPSARDKSGSKQDAADSSARRRRDSDESPPRRRLQDSGTSRRRERRDDSDESPPRRTKITLTGGSSKSSRENSKHDKSSKSSKNWHASSISPPNKSRQQDSDESPPRRKRKEGKTSDRSSPRGRSPKARQRSSDSDESAPCSRRSEKQSSRSHRNIEQSDESSPQRSQQKQSSSYSRREPERIDRRRRGRHDSDESPPRRSRGSLHQGSSRRSPAKSIREVSLGPSVRVKEEQNRSDSDLSPPRKTGRGRRPNSDESPLRRRRDTGRTSRSPTRHRASVRPVRIKEERRSSSDQSPPREATTGRMTKTLEGKRAGLQDARALREENEKHKRREAEAFEKMAVEHTGRFAETVVREKSGRRRDIEKELREEFEKRKQEEKKKEIYTRWGKGVKQVEEYNARLQEAVHEMDKPLARYADDKDLDEHLKEQERDGDPMLEYLRNKRKEENKRAGIPEKPLYQGAFPDNRYGIRPGYRWDGVDRSNGFEKRWFEMTSKKKATEEEAYKYSVEDM